MNHLEILDEPLQQRIAEVIRSGRVLRMGEAPGNERPAGVRFIGGVSSTLPDLIRSGSLVEELASIFSVRVEIPK